MGNMSLISLITLALAGAILGFLRYNFNPATIFLGDCGSLFIGFMLSALALYGGAEGADDSLPWLSRWFRSGYRFWRRSLSVARTVHQRDGRFLPLTANTSTTSCCRLGMSHRQVVIVLYASLGAVCVAQSFPAVADGQHAGIGACGRLAPGYGLGVQRLGLSGIRRDSAGGAAHHGAAALFVNNIAIRRATEELKVAESFSQVCLILTAAFDANDFDAFELRTAVADRGFHLVEAEDLPHMRWSKPGLSASPESGNAWSLSLDLISAANHHCGKLTIYRCYSSRDLQLDINLLTSAFASTLADAVHARRS